MIRGVGGLESFRVAAVALGRESEPVELSDRSHFVAGIAVHHRVCANQRETILVLIDVMD